MAARRVLRVRAVLPRAVSIWVRKSATRSASRSSIVSFVGVFPHRALAYRISSRNVSLYPATACRLASICVQRRSVKKRWINAGKFVAFIGFPPPPLHLLFERRLVPAVPGPLPDTSMYGQGLHDRAMS